MIDFPEISEHEIVANQITDTIKDLNFINYTIGEFAARKQRAEAKLQELLQHNPAHEGQVQYIHEQFAVTIKTGWNWSFDKKEYAIMKNHISACFNPVEEKISYVLNRQTLNDIELLSSGKERELLLGIFTKEPKKPAVTIKSRKV